jgi:hypothetical protein
MVLQGRRACGWGFCKQDLAEWQEENAGCGKVAERKVSWLEAEACGCVSRTKVHTHMIFTELARSQIGP